MLVVVQTPIIDLRLLQDDVAPLIRAPRWRRPRFFPAAQRDFVRGVGAVSLRKKEFEVHRPLHGLRGREHRPAAEQAREVLYAKTPRSDGQAPQRGAAQRRAASSPPE